MITFALGANNADSVSDRTADSAAAWPTITAVLCALLEPVPIAESHVLAETSVNSGLARPRRRVAEPRITRRVLLSPGEYGPLSTPL